SYYALAEDGKPKTVVILGPNHHGLGSGVSIMVEGVWRTPFADVTINSQIAKDIQAESKYIDIDEQAHLYEHSIELQLPFLQYTLGEDFDFIPISMMLQDFEVSIDVGKAVGKVLKSKMVNAVIIASSDLTHYEAQKTAEKKDLMVVESIKKLDEKELYNNIEKYNISMCGVGPTVAMLTASKILGAKNAKLLKYATSGDVTGDRRSVVGYCAMSIVKS
ncbi:MAG: AmmeMemoRadiSam system protein B, partial [Candidatus Bathyarchaeota archaeon]|nr:AmmeMemoRadiSam system protein B [Candidatus Bathyarchaeota archaeon]